MINQPIIKNIRLICRGFTLVEMAVVLVIVGLLLGGLFVPLSAQLDQRNSTQTQKTLADIKDALIGFASVNGRLPCPADALSAGQESISAGVCVTPYAGFVPGVALGLTPTDSQGFIIDGWGNRIHYAVTTANSNAYTTTNGLKAYGFTITSPNLYVCNANGGSTTNCGTATSLTTSAPAVIFSTGKNGQAGATGLDEAQNLDGNPIFVSHDITAIGTPNGEFDDIVVWLSNNVLINRMISAGQLP